MAITAKRQRGDVLDSLASPFRVDGAFRHMATQNLSGLDIDQLRGRAAFRPGEHATLDRGANLRAEENFDQRDASRTIIYCRVRREPVSCVGRRRNRLSCREAKAQRSWRQRIADRSWSGIPSVLHAARVAADQCFSAAATRADSRRHRGSESSRRTRRGSLRRCLTSPPSFSTTKRRRRLTCEDGSPAELRGRSASLARGSEIASAFAPALYKALSGEGNPELATVAKVAEALGFRLAFEPPWQTRAMAPRRERRSRGDDVSKSLIT